MKFLLNFCYDGSDFCGWQRQKSDENSQDNTKPSIQYVMENCLKRIFKTEIKLTASGRTDSGVHALNQYAHFTAQTRMKSENIIKALNSLLPNSIYIKACKVADSDFHARFSAISRTYLYKINKNFNPFERNYTAYFKTKKINTKKIKKIIKYLNGTYDFKVFANDTSHLNNCLCTIISVKWQETEDKFLFYITANRFLHNMVRRIVGTLIKTSHNALPDNYINEVLEKQDYKMLGETAPSQGLYLYDVEYDIK